MTRGTLFTWLCVLGALLGASLTWADGFMLPSHPTTHAIFFKPDVASFSVPYHKVDVTIDRQIATTNIDQAFRNTTNRQVEGTYIFPILDGMSLAKFSMWTGKEELTHRILEKDEARRIYNGIVAQRQDPALLEWLGSRMIQARVFPIEPKEDKRITISYQEVLQAQSGVMKYVYPLKTEKVSASPLQECSVNITINAEQPILTIYSPTHDITVTRKGDKSAVVNYSEKNVLPTQDLVLYYTVSQEDLGINLLTYRDPKLGDGYFLLLASPKVEVDADAVQPKDVVFVIDTSGSMSGKKIEQARGALKYCINSLDPRDRFSIIPFGSAVETWRKELQPATPANTGEAAAFAGKLKANGGTNISGALQTALTILQAGDAARPRSIVFLTDGQPTVGETNTDLILAGVRKANTGKVRIFDFGVGEDYNAHLLDKLANEHHGYAENVLPTESIEVKVSDFYSRVSAPLLMNLQLDWGAAEVYDIYPTELPDLFKGSQLIIAGRYRGKDHDVFATLNLRGQANGRERSYAAGVHFPTSSYADDFIPRLWATRKIGFLEEQLRLSGIQRELLAEVIKLSKEYGVLSQYTSFLVDLDVNPTAAPMGAVRGPALNMAKPVSEQEDMYEARVGAKRDLKAGADAVAQSVNSKAFGYASKLKDSTTVLNEYGQRVALDRLQNRARRSFVQNGAQWVDVNYAPAQRVVKVKAFSPAYLQLANANARMAQYMSMGDEVVIGLKDTAIQVAPDGQEQEFTTDEFKALNGEMTSVLGLMPERLELIGKAGALELPEHQVGFAWLLLPGAFLALRLRKRKTA